jgi:pyrimidine-nucleoside phosphorylase
VQDLRDFIRAKRDGKRHDPADLRAFITAYARQEIPDYQVSAWLMAAFLNGLEDEETEALTLALLHSGRLFDWKDLGRPSADKHSTGGVGDKVSLILAPLVASCGVLVPMVSGRGLGHTGGTLDKLESIPGFRTTFDSDTMRRQLDRIGVMMVGQGPDLAPADGLLYALRDVTSTVERDYFIVPSIVSKKVAEGAEAIVYDVKCGNAAFMKTRQDASRLARRLIGVTRSLGRRAAARVTDMSQPLGSAVGNALEVEESIAVLRGGGPDDVRSLTLELAAVMLRLSGASPDDEAPDRAREALDSGGAWERFVQLVRAQGGDPASVESASGLPRAPVVRPVEAAGPGVIEAVDGFGLGELVVVIGGGRLAKHDVVDPRVGIMVSGRVGDRVSRGDVLAELHLAKDDPGAVQCARACFRVGEGPAVAPELVLERID